MGSRDNTLKKMKVFQKGQVVIPSFLRKKYHLDIGDQIDIVPTEEGILLKPSLKKDEKSLTERLFGVFHNYAIKKTTIKKQEVTTATENGFIEGWRE